MDKQDSFWFLAGLGCGTLVGMLYAPLPGTRTRAIAAAKVKKARGLFHRSENPPQAGGAPEQAAETAPGARRLGERINRALQARRRTTPES